MFLITLILGGVVIWLIHIWVNGKFEYWKKHKIPYIPKSPFRLFYDYIFKNKSFLEIFREDYDKLNGHKFGGHFMFLTPSIMIRDADLIHQICIKDFSHFVDRAPPSNSSDSIVSQGLSVLTGNRWRALRHKLTPTFSSGKLKMMFGPIKENCDEVVNFINEKGDQAIEAKDLFFKFVVNVIGNVSFGLKVDALNEKTEATNEFLNISKTFFKPSFSLILKFIISTTFPKITKMLKFRLVDKNVDLVFTKLVQDTIVYREKSGEVRNDFLQLMIDQKKKEEANLSLTDSAINKTILSTKGQAEDFKDNELLGQSMEDENYKSIKVFTDKSIVAQAFLFISGGTDATATSLNFIFYNLTQNAKLQEKVQEEVDNVISKSGFTYQAIQNMNYMEMFINESMRIYGLLNLTRICTKDYTIPGTDVIIEKGTSITLPSLAIMNDSQYFSEPGKFNPKNFENNDTINDGANLVFGIGPRMCIAKRLAMLQMKLLVATILQHFTVKLSPKTKMPLKMLKPSIFQNVEGGVWVQFEKRNI